MPKLIRLHQHLAEMIFREGELGGLLSRLAQSSRGNDNVAVLLKDILNTSNTQQAALRVRLTAIGGGAAAAKETSAGQTAEPEFPVTAALCRGRGVPQPSDYRLRDVAVNRAKESR